MPATNDPQWRLILRLLRRAEPRIRTQLLDAIKRTQSDTIAAEVARALEAGDVEAAIDAVPWEEVAEPFLRETMMRELRDVFEDSGRAAASRIDGAAFSIINPRTMQALAEAGANLITEISETTRDGIRETIVAGNEEGLSAQRLAQRIKEELGLSAPGARAVANLRRSLVDEKVGAAEIRRRTASYARRLRRSRALTVARTETLRAASAGKRAAWEEAIELGVLDPNIAEREWLTAKDSHVRESHRIHGQIRGLSEPFELRSGALAFDAPPESTEGINCRCITILHPRGKKDKTPTGGTTDYTADDTAAFSPPELDRSPRATSRRQVRLAANKAQKRWVNGSQGAKGVLVAEALRDEFGLSGAIHNPKNFSVDKSSDEYRETKRGLRFAYRRTQAALKNDPRIVNGKVKLYRGLGSQLHSNAVESWTIDADVAQRFADFRTPKKKGIVIVEEIPVEKIVFFEGGPEWVNGRYGAQAEWVVIGRDEGRKDPGE